jgi:N-acetylneuraminic acid mutarotase
MRRIIITYLSIFLLSILVLPVPAQQIPDLPIPMGAGTAVVWNNQIFHFGGSNNWSGSICYPRVYKYDGITWSYQDSIPDNNMWDPKSILLGNDVYLIGGWPAGANYTRRYNLVSGEWTYLATSPNTQTWGVTSSYYDGIIYLFDSYGNTFAYNIGLNSWETKPNNGTTANWDLSSVLYKNELYIIGYTDTAFYKYTPANDHWTRLADSPYPVGGCAMGVINDSIYCIGGNMSGEHGATYQSAVVYDVPSNTWTLSNTRLSSKRHWMATVEYAGGLYVVGGLDSASYAVNTVEEIVPQGTAVTLARQENVLPKYLLKQNYPNPFNPLTTIEYTIAAVTPQPVTLKLFNLNGQLIRVLVDEIKSAGTYSVKWNSLNQSGIPVNSGVYLYLLRAGDFTAANKMILLK